ncbi:AAA family ATPase [Actinoplanes sp. CA-051413]|uniref:helix-turn-helix transcriptional regulator n=1 Tax=Actinoplanes sp. CA-051413 TaxID=3239899 RepID=UPI003D962C80
MAQPVGFDGEPDGVVPRTSWSAEPVDLRLLGRQRECRALDGLVAGVRAGQSGVLVLRGEAGIGRSALLDHVAEQASGCRVARLAGVESESELAIAGLHWLCSPLLDHLDRLPGPQRQALAIVFGIVSGPPPDRFLIALAVLSLLADAAADTPLVCLVDDAQWLDQASARTLGFVARRLHAYPIALVFALRGDPAEPTLTGLPELVVEGLGDADAQLLLASVLPVPVDDRVRGRIAAEAGGNPLALRQLPYGFASGELSFGFGTADPALLPGRIEQGYLRLIAALPEATRRLLLIAALEPDGDATVLWRAARCLGLPPDAIVAATSAGLIEISSHVRFRHPLVRSAACRAAADRVPEAHRVLADLTDPGRDPDRRAWHRAHATAGPDDAVAAELERSADRALSRGGVGAAAAFLARAAQLSTDPAAGAQLALAAAGARHEGGAFDAALALLAVAQAGPLSSIQQVQVDLVRARVISGPEAPGLFVDAARRFAPVDPQAARDTYLEAFGAAFSAARLASGTGTAGVARAARAAPRTRRPRATDLLLDGWVAVCVDGCRTGVPLLRKAVAAFCREDAAQPLHVLPLASAAAADTLDDQAWETLATRHLLTARQLGALSELPIALHGLTMVHVLKGQLDVAAALVAESRTVAEVTGAKLWPYGAVALAAFDGRDSEPARTELSRLADGGQGAAVTVLHWAEAVLGNAHGQYQEAVVAATGAIADPDELGQRTPALVELVEAASRTGLIDVAADALRQLSALTRAGGTDWARGLEARCRALVSTDDAAESCYREATQRLGRTRIRVDAARAHLLYGEWLRRRNRRVDAREQLRIAHELFTAMGTHAFAERARRELTATGLTVRKRSEENTTRLTDHESQIVRLVGNGLTNPEIGAELFISPRTVEWHLRKVFSKLGVTSRRQLTAVVRE